MQSEEDRSRVDEHHHRAKLAEEHRPGQDWSRQSHAAMSCAAIRGGEVQGIRGHGKDGQCGKCGEVVPITLGIRMEAKHDEQTSPYYAAARLWLDAIIEPKDTRKWISMGIEAANNTPTGEYKVGVIQT